MMNRRSFIAKSIASSLAGRVDASFPSSITDKRSLLIDSHVHVWKHDPAFPFAQGTHLPSEDATVETLLELMEANAVDRTVLIQVIHYRWDNSYLANVLKRYPGRFKAVCRVNPEDPKAPDQLSRLTEEHGFHSVRISPGAGEEGDWIRGSLMPPLWRRCAQLKVPMTILTPVTRLPDLVPWIEQNPDLIVVIDHMADCPLDRSNDLKLLTSLASYPKVFVKISHMWSISKQPYPYRDTNEQIKLLYKSFGARRLMWGTDLPQTPLLSRSNQSI
jgi:L-fuconolactonase